MRWPRTALGMNRSSAPAESETKRIIMMKKYGVCFGILVMGLAIVGTPVARSQNRMAANGAGGVTEASTTSASVAPAASTPADLDRRVEELEKELVELRTELASRKTAEEAPAASPVLAAPQDKPADKGPEKVTVASLLGPTSVSGFVDGYYQVNFNHPVGAPGT